MHPDDTESTTEPAKPVVHDPLEKSLQQRSGDEILVGTQGIHPENAESLFRIARAAARSGVFPQLQGSADHAFTIMSIGMELGFTPFRSLSAVILVEGKPSVPGEAALALVRARGALEPGSDVEKVYSGEGDDYGCHVAIHRKGQKRPFDDRFTVREAKLGGLWGKKTRSGAPTPWILYPDAMLFWRAVGRIMREHFSDILLGLYTTEELRDVQLQAGVTDGDGPEQLPATIQPDPLLAGIAEEDDHPVS